ncbi:MAG: hypothetical protein RRY69_08085 [Oscillospiraceae bacterium]
MIDYTSEIKAIRGRLKKAVPVRTTYGEKNYLPEVEQIVKSVAPKKQDYRSTPSSVVAPKWPKNPTVPTFNPPAPKGFATSGVKRPATSGISDMNSTGYEGERGRNFQKHAMATSGSFAMPGAIFPEEGERDFYSAMQKKKAAEQANRGNEYHHRMTQKLEEYSNIPKLPDFSQYSRLGSATTVPDFEQYNKSLVRDRQSMELNPAAYAQSAPAIENPLKYYLENKSKQSDYGYDDDILIEGDSHYWQMLTEEEKSVYNYLLAKKGDKAADEYLSDIQEELNRRYGEAVAENLKDRPILKGAYSVGAGAIGALSNTIQGLGAMSGSEEVLPSSAWEYAHAKNVENSNGIGKFVYNLGYNLGNMAPQLAAGYMTGGLFGPGVASTASGAAMAVPTFGDAYADALQGGYTKTQAVTYAGLSAAKEVGLSYLLGGFDKAGKVSLGKLGEKALPKIEQAIARVAKKPTLNALLKTASAVVAYAGGEFTEEYLQELITPVLRNVIFGEKNSVNMFTPEALEAGIMGSALSLLVNVFGMNIKNDYAAQKLKSNLVAAYLDSGESHAVATKKADSQIARIFNGSLMLELEEEQFAATKAGRSEGNIVGMSTVLMRDDGQDEMTIRNVNKLAVFPATDFDYELPPPQLDELKKQIEGAYAKGEKLTLFKGKNGNVQMFFTDKSGKTSHNLAVTPNGKTEKIYGVKSGDLRLKPEVFVPYADSDVTPGAVAGQEAAQMEKQTTNTYEVKTPSRGDMALQEQGNMSDDLKSQSAGHDIANTGIVGDSGNEPELGNRVKLEHRTTEVVQRKPQSFSELVKEYGALRHGENQMRIIDVPAKTSPNNKVTLAARTLMEADVPDDFILKMEKAVETGEFSYFAQSNQSVMLDAASTIKTVGYSGALGMWENKIECSRYEPGMSPKERLESRLGKKVVNSTDLALAIQLMQEAQHAGDTKLAVRLAAEIAAESHNAGQLLQATRLIKKMSPEGQLYYLQIAADKLANDCKLKYGEKIDDIKVDEVLAEHLLKAKTQEEVNVSVEAIKDNIGKQIPATWLDKWNQWRYLSMLGNPKTHIRNILGNASFLPARMMKNVICAGIESGVNKLTGKNISSTKALLTKKDAALRAFAKSDYLIMSDQALGGGKYEGASTVSDIMEVRQIYKFKPLEAVRKANSAALEAEDIWFNRPAYTDAFAQYMKANKLTPEFLESRTAEANKALTSARDVAVMEAQKATYRDASEVADIITKLANRGNIAGFIINGVLPFRKTPINILKRGLEYSPIGLVKSLTVDLAKVKAGRITASQAIDNISAGLSGMAISLLGVLLSSMGLVSGSRDDDEKQRKFEELQGWQPYSLIIGDYYYSIDWMAPSSLPFFVGVEFQKLCKKESGWTVSGTVNALSRLIEPMYNMSMLQGVNSLLETASYSKSKPLTDVFVNSITGYVTQGVPTLGGQAARTIDGTRRDAYVTNNPSGVEKGLEVMFNRQKAKIPVLSSTGQPYIDEWGREETTESVVERILTNFVSPGYLSKKNTTDVDDVIQGIFNETGEKSVLPDSASSGSDSLKRDGEEYDLSSNQKTKYAKARGKAAFDTIKQLISDNRFNALSKEEQAEIIEDVYEYSTGVAKRTVGADAKGDWTERAFNVSKQGASPIDYIVLKNIADTNNNRSLSNSEVSDAIESEFGNLPISQRAALYRAATGCADSKNIYSTAQSLESNGVRPEQYIDFISNADNGNDGRITQAEAFSYLEQQHNISKAQKAVLWDTQGWKKNPYV